MIAESEYNDNVRIAGQGESGSGVDHGWVCAVGIHVNHRRTAQSYVLP